MAALSETRTRPLLALFRLLRQASNRIGGSDRLLAQAVLVLLFFLYVLTSTFSFNLLMGRRWPASPEDLREAETLCR